jgi:DNA primase catalytic core
MVDKQVIEEIKNNANIVEVIGDVISLQKAGRNYLGLCPFHGEKTPSFNVVEDKQFYHCFGCGRSGDVFKFIEEYQGVPFMEAVQILGQRVGIEVEKPLYSEQKPASPHQALYDMHEDAAKFYHAILMTTTMGEEARNYLYQRGLTDEVLKHFRIGLAPPERNYLYQRLSGQYRDEDFLDSGLFYLSDANQFVDTFHNRIMFPLTNDQGKVIAFSGRIWQKTDSQTSKYKNSRSTAIFNKSYELYHMDRAKKSSGKASEIYLMEGFMDVIAAYRAGIENAVASMGTALSHEHVEHLKRLTKKLVLVYDGDKAGQAATLKALDEIGDMPLDVQTRLLRVLADGQFYRVGGYAPVKVDVRIIAATHQNLELRVQEGKFREDLFHRLNVIRIHLPPLRERREDIPRLTQYFLQTAARELGVETKILHADTITAITHMQWPGNVRQLENTCRWLTVMAAGQEVLLQDLPPELFDASAPTDAVSTSSVPDSWSGLLAQWAERALRSGDQDLLSEAQPEMERVLLTKALQHTRGHKQEAARLLGWGRNTLTRKLKELGME